MIKITKLTKQYEDRVVLNDISLNIETNTMLAILGQSGAGKSTLLHIIGSLETADKGEISINGLLINKFNHKQLANFRNQHLGFIFQFHYLLPEFTALENVCIPYWVKKTGDRQAGIDKAMYLLDALGIGDLAQSKPNQLSGGEQQRVSIARALVNNPSYVLADEPTGNLDTTTSLQFMNLILQLKKEIEFTFVMVTHNESLINQFDKTISIADGKIVS